MMHVPGIISNSLYAYFYYFTGDQWLYYYASGHSVRENQLSACPGVPAC